MLSLKPHVTLLCLSALVLALGFVQFSKVISVNIYDTYYIARRIHLSVPICLLLIVFAAVLYFLDAKSIYVSRSAVAIYAVLTLLSILVLYLTPLFEQNPAGRAPREAMRVAHLNGRLGVAMLFSNLAFLLLQLGFVISVLFKWIKN